MTIKDALEVVKNGLAPLARRHKGSVTLAHDIPHLYRILAGNPGAPRLGILLVSEKPRNEKFADVTNRLERRIWIAISRGYNLEAYAGKSLEQGVAGGEPMYVLLEELRTAARRLRFETDGESIPYYMAIELLTFEGVTLDAYRLEIVVACDTEDSPEDAGPSDSSDLNSGPVAGE